MVGRVEAPVDKGDLLIAPRSHPKPVEKRRKVGGFNWAWDMHSHADCGNERMSLSHQGKSQLDQYLLGAIYTICPRKIFSCSPLFLVGLLIE